MTPDYQYPLLGSPTLVKGKNYIISDRAAFVGQIYTVVCPVCGKHLEAAPDKKGIQTLLCPNNDSKITYAVKEVKARKVKEPVDEKDSTTETKHPKLGVPTYVSGKTYLIKEKAVVGKTYTIVCPVCGEPMEVSPSEKGSAILKCPNNDSIIGYKAKEAKHKTGDDSVHTHRSLNKPLKNIGRLEWGGFLSKKKAKLHVGTNIVGREDAESPSEISFNDKYMSRQSISIDVEKDPNRSGYNFKLTVLNASNPVYVGSHSLLVGNSIYLNYEDTIKLGNTVLRFKEDK